jgi:hypothetical protein
VTLSSGLQKCIHFAPCAKNPAGFPEFPPRRPIPPPKRDLRLRSRHYCAHVSFALASISPPRNAPNARTKGGIVESACATRGGGQMDVSRQLAVVSDQPNHHSPITTHLPRSPQKVSVPLNSCTLARYSAQSRTFSPFRNRTAQSPCPSAFQPMTTLHENAGLPALGPGHGVPGLLSPAPPFPHAPALCSQSSTLNSRPRSPPPLTCELLAPWSSCPRLRPACNPQREF